MASRSCVVDRHAEAEAEHLVQRRAFGGTQRAAAGDLERRDAVGPAGAGRHGTEIDLGAVDPSRQLQRRVQHCESDASYQRLAVRYSR